jgi:hypothetical protein
MHPWNLGLQARRRTDRKRRGLPIGCVPFDSKLAVYIPQQK